MILEIFKKLIIQSLPCSVKTFRHKLKLRLKDQLIQIWYGNISESRKCINYRIFENHFEFEKYLVNFPDSLRKFSKNSDFAIIVCRLNVDAMRTSCPICLCVITGVNIYNVGDEYHYSLTCNHLEMKENNMLKVNFGKEHPR